MNPGLTFLVMLLPAVVSAVGHSADATVTATSSQRVHPVLIRNEFNEVVDLLIQVSGDEPVRLLEAQFRLEGTGLTGDVDSLELFAVGKDSGPSPRVSFGTSCPPAKVITIRGDRELSKGANFFRLSCRLKGDADLSHRVGAVCTAIETSRGSLQVEDQTPGRSHRIGVAVRRQMDDGVHTYRIPALATSPRGTLLCVYDMRRTKARDLQEDIDIGLSRSTDGGQTWEPTRVIMDMGEYGGLPQSQNGCSDPGLLVDGQTGEIFCFAVWMNGKPGKHQWREDGSEPGFEIGKSAQFLMVRSRDDGKTWSQPENLTRALKRPEWWLLAPSPQQGITLPDGILVMPIQGRDAKGTTFSTLMSSRDHGRSWTVGNPAYFGSSECQAVRLGDGSIMLNMRNDHERFRAVTVTHDLGKTWIAHPTSRNTLIEPTCNASLLRVDLTGNARLTHVLLFANPHSQKARTHQTIQVSFDDGRAWPETHHRLLDEGRGAGYPSLTRVDADHVGIIYEGSQAHLVFERFSLAELLQSVP